MTNYTPHEGNLNSTALEKILAGCRAADSQAQKQLYQHFYAYGLAICLHYGSNREEAEEMLHNGFIRVFERIGQYRGTGNFKAWLRTVIVRSAITYFKKSQKRSKRFTRYREQYQPEKANNFALHALGENDAYLLLQLLTPAYRMVLSLHILEGYTHREISELMGISVGTSKSNLSKAKKKLAELIKTYYPRVYECFND